jgi:arylsulfatase A-like enzyme
VRGTHITVGLPLALVLTGCSEEPLSLIDLAPAGESVETVGGRRALTPGFPSDLTFRVRLPEEPFLDFSVAVLASKEVGRGSVAFSVRLDDEGQRFTVYEEIIRARVGRTFQSRRVNLAAWRGKEVALILGAEPAHPEAVGAWVEEVQVAWGEPRVENRPLAPAVAQPSIVLILVDTLRRDYLGFHGFEGPISPNLDWLAKESVMFENAFTQAPWTKPSIASLFTSLHPDTHGLDNHEGLFGHRQNQALTTGVLPAEAVTLAEALKGAGYRTAAFVANPWIHGRYGFDQGFDSYEVVETLPEILERARGFVRKDEGRPFFVYLHFMDVHGPYDSPEEDFQAIGTSPSLAVREEPHAGALVKLPSYLAGIPWFEDEELQHRTFGEIISFRLTRSHTVRARYAANVLDFDRRIAPFLNEVRNSELNQNAILVLTSDHGEELLEHGGWDHGFNLYEHQIRVPLLIRTSGAVDAGRRLTRAANLVDVMPTLLALANVDAPEGIEGEDLLGPDATDEASFSAATKHREGVHAVRTERYKLIFDGKTGSVSLFDLEADPGEYRDIASEKAVEAQKLLALLSRHIEESRRFRLHPQNAIIPDEIRKRLESLGYLKKTK